MFNTCLFFDHPSLPTLVFAPSSPWFVSENLHQPLLVGIPNPIHQHGAKRRLGPINQISYSLLIQIRLLIWVKFDYFFSFFSLNLFVFGTSNLQAKATFKLRSENSDGDSKNMNEISSHTSKANKGKKGRKERKWKGEKKKKERKEEMVCKRRHLTFYSQSFFLCSIKKNMCQIKEIVEEAVENGPRHFSF